MCEVTRENYEKLFSSIEDAIRHAVFISVDCEFSMLNGENGKSSLFDTPEERYFKMKSNLLNAIPMEIGLTAFHFDRDNIIFTAHPYKFFVFPESFAFFNSHFICSASSFMFLSDHNFDFNKFVYSGIPYISLKQEEELQKYMDKGNFYEHSLYYLDISVEDQLQEISTKVSHWFYVEIGKEEYVIENIDKRKCFILYTIRKKLLNRFPKKIWITEEDNKLKIQRVTEEQYMQLSKGVSFESELKRHVLGFTRIFKLLISLQKPIVGHNCINDILLLINTFYGELPHCYKSFKELVSQLFPTVYDTKHISFEIWKYVEQSAEWKSNGLQDLYDFFKNESGRHLVAGSPPVEIASACRSCKDMAFHDAGWDAYATGYCFVRMMHIIAAKKYESHSKKYFLATEYMKAMEHLQNRVNLIRASTAYMNLHEPDPVSERPPCFIIESKNDKPIDIFRVTDLLTDYGTIEIKPYTTNGRLAIATFGNYNSARRIVAKFRNHQDFRIVMYSPVLHSTYVRAALWGGVLSSTGMFLCLLRHFFK